MVNFLGEEISKYYSILVVVWLLKDLFSSVYSENSNKRIGKWCHQLNAPRHTHKKCKMISKDFSLKREYFEKNKAAGKRCLVKTTIFRNKFPSLTRLTFNHLKPWLKENQIHIQLEDTDRSCNMCLIFSRILNIKSMGSWRLTPSFQEKTIRDGWEISVG